MVLKNDLIFSLTQFSNVFRDTLDKTLKESGLYSGQIYILIALWEKDGQTQISLARELNLSSPTIHKMVRSLARNGFVNSSKCDLDARQMRVYLTEKGVAVQPLVEKQWIVVETKIFGSLTTTEKIIFGQLLEKLKSDLA